MRMKYTIEIDTNSVPAEIAVTHVMTQFFELVVESNLTGKELCIKREDLPDKTLEEYIVEMK